MDASLRLAPHGVFATPYKYSACKAMEGQWYWMNVKKLLKSSYAILFKLF